MDSSIALLTIFVLAVFVGFEVVSKVSSTLHTPLMSGANAIHGIILVGAIIVAGRAESTAVLAVALVAVVLAAMNLVGGFVGTLYLGFFAIDTGLFVGGDLGQLAVQAIAAFGVAIYSFVVAFVLGLGIQKTIGFRIKNEDEIAGIDRVVHGEEGYVLSEVR